MENMNQTVLGASLALCENTVRRQEAIHITALVPGDSSLSDANHEITFVLPNYHIEPYFSDLANEINKNILLNHHTKLSPLHSNTYFIRTSLRTLFCLTMLMWLINLILRCGDIHRNSGPDSVSIISESSSVDSFQYLSNHLSIFHLNIQFASENSHIKR